MTRNLPTGRNIPSGAIPTGVTVSSLRGDEALGTYSFPDSSVFVAGARVGSATIQNDQFGDVFYIPDNTKAELVYNFGPDTVLVLVRAVAAIEPSSDPTTMALGIDLNGDLLGNAMDSSTAQQRGIFPVQSTDAEPTIIEANRMVVMTNGGKLTVCLATGETAARIATGLQITALAWEVGS